MGIMLEELVVGLLMTIISTLFALMPTLKEEVGDIPFGASIDLNSVRVLE